MAVKELTQAVIGARVIRETGHVFSAKWFGKLCTVITTASIMAMFAFPQLPERVVNALLILCAAMMLCSLALYIDHFKKYKAAADREKEQAA